MIKKINISNVASYKTITSLETDKKVNLVYGLNGTGKSIFSNFLYDRNDNKYSGCSIEGITDEENISVYNKKFIDEFFYVPDNLEGIFTLSKENKEAEQKILETKKKRDKLNENKEAKDSEIKTINTSIAEKESTSENKTWEIKINYSGGDRVLDFCLDGLKKEQKKLFNYILSIQKPTTEPSKTIKELEKDVQSLLGKDAQKYSPLSIIQFFQHTIETDAIFQKEIIGNENSTFADLIKKLKNSDWVKEGLEYLPSKIDKNGNPCPFCQSNTITNTVASDIKSYFDESYKKDQDTLRQLLSDYETAIKSIISIEIYKTNPFVLEQVTEIENKYNQVIEVLKSNKSKIEKKIENPSQRFSIENSTKEIETFNQFIRGINKTIDEYNKKLDNKQNELENIKKIFWDIMRWDYDQIISSYIKEERSFKEKKYLLEEDVRILNDEIKNQNNIITQEQKKTTNIEDAIDKINGRLIDLGIDSFIIKKDVDKKNFYKIVRGNSADKLETKIFETLSEGEKMIITFLYFVELCKDKKINSTETGRKEIIVIDDPISSLSHIYIFNIGQLIKTEFLNSKNYKQVFLLTHNLYFFYELTDINHERREANQKLFRLVKNSDGSHFDEMRYEEIQNDYHAYWQIIKNDGQPPALIANCMRNIIEYFFNFIEKVDLNDVFQKSELKDNNKCQALYRYINRESHSSGQNIFDSKEFDYNYFKEAFSLVFKKNGYEKHYNKMIKIK